MTASKPSALWKRLPLIVFALGGFWLWKGGAGLVSTEHSLVWKVPGAYASIRRLEVQLWDQDELLTRFELNTPTGLTLDPERRLTLRRGPYRSQVLVWREGAATPAVSRSAVVVGDEPTVVIR